MPTNLSSVPLPVPYRTACSPFLPIYFFISYHFRPPMFLYFLFFLFFFIQFLCSFFFGSLRRGTTCFFTVRTCISFNIYLKIISLFSSLSFTNILLSFLLLSFLPSLPPLRRMCQTKPQKKKWKNKKYSVYKKT